MSPRADGRSRRGDAWRARRRAAGWQRVHAEATRALDAGHPTAWFEPVYHAAGRDRAQVPWTLGTAHPFVTDWLRAPVLTPPGPTALVTGCGLGDDARALADAGYEVTGVDVAPSAIAWARRRHRRHQIRWETADLLTDAITGLFDLVVEVGTVRMLPGVVRDAMMDAVAQRVAPGGVLVVVTSLAQDAEVARAASGPPWPQAPSELAVYRGPGLVRIALEHGEVDDDGTVEVRATFQRPRGTAPGARPDAGSLPIIGS